jgi:DNA-directed RNA polymerase
MLGLYPITPPTHDFRFHKFMARYKGYKIPLAHLRVGKFVKQLHDAGSRIIATPEQAKSLEAIKELVVVSETEPPTVDESAAAMTVETLKEYAAALSNAPTKDGEVDVTNLTELLEEDELEEDEEDGEWVSPQTKAAKRRKTAAGKAAIELMGKFVNVTDILPPLPERGSFKVETIKGSQYFFS